MNIAAEGRDGLTEVAMRRVGSVLNGKWRLDAMLGLGGTAAVYAATHRNGHRVAIKVLHAHFSLDHGVRTRLEQEGYVANLIDHPGAVRISDDDRTPDGSVFLVMELLEGEGLEQRLKRKGWRLPRNEALGIIYALLDVLAAAHAKGVIHRDIKPDNIFITREGQVKVLDFGIARLLELPPQNRTRNGALFGTLGFMAPEQALARSHEIDARTDLWSVGATLFTLLSGRLVHEAPTPNEQLVNAATRPAPPLSTVVPEIDAAVAALVDRALAFRPIDRWQNASAMQEAVREIVVATPGLESMPLSGPRLSVEIDIGAVTTARGGWSSASLKPSIVREVMPPTMVARPIPARWVQAAILVAAGAGSVFASSALLRRLAPLPAAPALAPAAPTTPEATRSFLLPPEEPGRVPVTSTEAVAIPTAVITPTTPGLPPASSLIAEVSAPLAKAPDKPRKITTVASAITTAKVDLNSMNSSEAAQKSRRRMARRMPPASPASIADDDALWDRRK